MEDKLVAYDDSSSNQIAVVIITNLKDPSNGNEYEDEEVALEFCVIGEYGQKEVTMEFLY